MTLCYKCDVCGKVCKTEDSSWLNIVYWNRKEKDKKEFDLNFDLCSECAENVEKLLSSISELQLFLNIYHTSIKR